MLEGIWDNDYVQYLGILEHLDECKVLHDEYLTTKAKKESSDKIYSTFEHELVDLYLILQKRFHNNQLVEERLNKFKSKAKNND